MQKYVKYVKISEPEYQQIKNQLETYTVGRNYEGAGYKFPKPSEVPRQEEVEFHEEETSGKSPFETA